MNATEGDDQLTLLMRAVAVLVATLGFVLRFHAMGWLFLFGGFLYCLAASLAHAVIHFVALRKPLSDQQLRLAAVSNGLLLLAFLFQWDMGDDCGNITVVYLVAHYFANRPGPGSGLCIPDFGFMLPTAVNVLLFGPVCVTWIQMTKRRAMPVSDTACTTGQADDA